MHADRTNRFMLTLTGLLMLLAGAAGLLASVGGFGTTFQTHTLFHNGVSRFIGRHGDGLWTLAAIGCALLAVLVLRWLRALLLSTDRAGDLTVAGDRSHGRTVITPTAVTAALSEQVLTYRGVASAKARLIGASDDPHLIVTVAANAGTDLTRLRQRIEAGALNDVRTALDDPHLAIRLDLALTTSTTARVH
jgi:hypothetical protein